MKGSDQPGSGLTGPQQPGRQCQAGAVSGADGSLEGCHVLSRDPLCQRDPAVCASSRSHHPSALSCQETSFCLVGLIFCSIKSGA